MAGGTVDFRDEFFRLQNQYRLTAKELKEKGKFKKAAFIYLKLLKDYNAAAAPKLMKENS